MSMSQTSSSSDTSCDTSQSSEKADESSELKSGWWCAPIKTKVLL